MNRLCHEQGVGLIPYSPLARGFLAANRSKDGGGATERSKNDVGVTAGTYRDSDWEIAERLKKVAAGKNCSPAQAALAWMLSKPYMAAPIIGATSLDQLTSAAQATEVTLTADEVKLLEEPYEFRVSPANSAASFSTRRDARAPQRPGEVEGQQRQEDGGEPEDRHRAIAVDDRRGDRHADRLADEQAEREQRQRRAARFGRHLRAVGLQRVVQHVEGDAAGHDRGEGHDGVGRQREDGEGEAEAGAAPQHQPALAQQAHEMARRRHIKEAAGAERRDRQADRGEAEAEAQMQVGADEGEAAPEHATFQRHHDDHRARPAPAQHTTIWLTIEPAARSPGRAMSGARA